MKRTAEQMYPVVEAFLASDLTQERFLINDTYEK
jgi:hypothetical protein